MKFCCIIPDRNDRTELTQFCFKQLERMTVKPDAIFHVNYMPASSAFDLVNRMFIGTRDAQENNFDWCYCIENDDYYPADYFERSLPYLDNLDFIGDQSTTYYNLQNCTYRTFDHNYRSSLFTTAFRISALNLFVRPNETPFLDIELWRYARHKRRKFIDTGVLGMKHGIGLCGGIGHRLRMKNADVSLKYLRSKVDEESFQFYLQLITDNNWVHA